ncbi:hypothetical protein GALMADRAFT_148732 [Galerina marginata CBS 339.88]|uniref:Uncharacterized protein n=1 Tax=Galerina marginata (strain CBS 339.88) TaxID=685588 RepID=A0A067SF57_GALM3|nr:hypothetical protein GALMADRAFT_148732 [Galerina marginata CBS 339.88]
MDYPNFGRDNPDSMAGVEINNNMQFQERSAASLTAEQIFFQKLVQKMEQSDTKMLEVLATTVSLQSSMVARADATDAQISQLARQFRERLGPVPEEVVVNPADVGSGEDVIMTPEVQVARRRIRRDENEADDESDPENSQQSLPQIAFARFPRSIIGAGPEVRLRNTAPSNSANVSSGHAGGQGGTLEQAIFTLTNRVNQLSDEMNQTRIRKYGTSRSREFRLPPQRFTTPDRNARLRAVRSVMNRLLGIKRDVDVITMNQADENDIAAFGSEGNGPGPIAPYAPDWLNIGGPWNHALLIIFMEEFVKEYTVEEEEHQDDICKMFMDRLKRLRKKVLQGTQQPGETQVDMTARYLVNHRRLLKLQRRNTRRNERFDTRSRITVQNALAQTNEAKRAWEHLDDVLVALGPGGMSSDESDVENGQKVYYVKKMSWRRAGLTGKVCVVDRDRNITNTYGNVRAGNPPRIRKRRHGATETSRSAPPGRPINFYDADWLSQLTPRQRKDLGPIAAKELLEFDNMG